MNPKNFPAYSFQEISQHIVSKKFPEYRILSFELIKLRSDRIFALVFLVILLSYPHILYYFKQEKTNFFVHCERISVHCEGISKC